MNVFLIISMAFLGLLLFGFLWGMLRSWKKSLIRFIILIVDVVIALFTSPLISKALIKNIANGTTITIFDYNFDITKLINDLLGSNLTNDLASATEVTNELATALINVLLNIVIFFVMFIVLWILSLIIYAIIVAIVKGVSKKDKKEKNHESIWLRLVGGLIGTVSMCVIFFAFMIPLFGAMNICNNFIEKDDGKNKASAYMVNSYVCGQLYYKDDDKIGKIETYVEKYSDVKQQYDKSIIGGFCNTFGLSVLGGKSFSYLTNVSSGELELNFSNEVVSAIKTYNAYKTAFVANEFNVKDNNSIDRLEDVLDTAIESEIVSKYVVEILPTAATKWSSGETFIGIENPVNGEFEPVLNHLLEVFKVKNINRINSNLKVMFDLIKVSNNNGFTDVVSNKEQDGSDALLNYFYTENTLIKDSILTLSKTEEFRNCMPKVFNDILNILFNSMIGGESNKAELDEYTVSGIDWEKEATSLQSIVDELMGVHKIVEQDKKIIDELGRIGKILDLSRQSQMLSNSLKTLITNYIKSDKLVFVEDAAKNEELKLDLASRIETNWGNNSDPHFFENSFAAIAETYKVASSLGKGEEVDLNNLKNAIVLIRGNEGSKTLVLDIINGQNGIIGTDDASVATKTIIVNLINSEDSAIDSDIEAGKQIIDIASKSKQSGDGNKVTVSETESDEFVKDIAASKTILGTLDSSADKNDEVSKVMNNIDDAGKQNILNSADKLYKSGEITEDEKKVFDKVFGG